MSRGSLTKVVLLLTKSCFLEKMRPIRVWRRAIQFNREECQLPEATSIPKELAIRIKVSRRRNGFPPAGTNRPHRASRQWSNSGRSTSPRAESAFDVGRGRETEPASDLLAVVEDSSQHAQCSSNRRGRRD